MKRGISTFNISRVPYSFKSYVREDHLPPVPKHFGHVMVDAPHGGWGMLGNDQYGDCTMAGIAHGQMVWNWAAGGEKTIPSFDANGIISQYQSLTGGADNGLDPVDVADWWMMTGLVDSKDNNYKIRNYTAVNTVDDAAQAAYLFGFSGLAIYMPDNSEDEFSAGRPWADTSGDPEPNRGHFVPLVGRNSAGHYMIVTWGRLHACTPKWLNKYFAGGLAYTSKSYMKRTGLSPEGYDFAALDADLSILAKR